MGAEVLNHKLYVELLFAGLILLSILLANNIFLYKQKIKEPMTLMLIAAVTMSAFEILWTLVEGNPGTVVISYISACMYCVAFVAFSMFFNYYLIDRFGIRLRKQWIAILYALPFAAFSLLCLSSPLTSLVVWVDGKGLIHEGVLFNTLFMYILLFYFFSPIIIAIFFLTVGKSKKPAGAQIPVSLFIFGVMTPMFYNLEMLHLDNPDTPYQALSVPVSLALVYLVTNVSTHTALDARANMEAVEADLRIASKIQADALPDAAPEFADYMDLNLRASMNTAKEVGGDFYDYFPIDENRLCFLIADVSGKGTPAALFMMTAKTMIKDYAMTLDSTSEIFTTVNARLSENNEAGMFATAWIGIIDKRTMTLQYTNAGHNYPVFKRRGQPCEWIRDKHGLFLAGMEFTQYKQAERKLEPGDRIVLYTDGVTEAHDANKNLYGEDRLEAVIERTKDETGDQVVEAIVDDVNEYAKGVPQFDDITMIVLTIKEKTGGNCNGINNRKKRK